MFLSVSWSGILRHGQSEQHQNTHLQCGSDQRLKKKQVLTTSLSKIWENTDGCAEQYRCASALYLM